MKNIVIIGGGTGTFTLLSGLRKFPSNNSVIVSTADDGGSTGKLRKDLDVVPPGDIRQCLLGLSYTEESMRKLMSYRFEAGELKGHAMGNLILAALEKVHGSVEPAIAQVARMLNVRGQVLPVTLSPTILTAELESGKKLIGEHSIDDREPKGKASPIKRLKLSAAAANPRALKAIREADVIVFGPGDLYTSILPNVLVKGMAETIGRSKAKKVLVTNIMTRFGQTDGFKASDFVRILCGYVPKGVDTVLVNTQKPSAEWLKRYKKEKAEFIEPDIKNIQKQGVEAVAKPLLSSNTFSKQNGDKLKRSYLRHDADKTAGLIWELISK